MSEKKGKSEGMREGDVFLRQARGYKGQHSALLHIPPKYAGRYCKVVVLEGL
jgi:hypothetical protein